MEHPQFDKEKEARAWIVEDAIREATEPFLPILTDVGIADLRDVLEDAAASHPILRVFATRAAKALLPQVEPEERREAARRRGKDDLDDFGVSKAPPPKIRDAALSGMPDLSKPEFYDPTIAIIKTLAARVAEKSRAPVKGPFRDELVQEGWRCTCEVCSKWDSTKSAYTTYIWRCVRATMIDYAKKGSNWRDRPAGCVVDTMDDPTKERSTDAVKRFREAMRTAAASFAFGWAEASTPEEALIRVRDREAVRACVKKLDARSQALLALIYVEGMELAPAGAKLDMPKSTAQDIHKRALRDLADMLAASSNVRALRPRKLAS